MNEKQIEQLLLLQSQQAASLERIADLVEAFVKNTEEAASTSRYRYYKSLREYPDFDWSSIGATLIDDDESGATAIAWKNKRYTRRANAKYSSDIWFSCGTGKDEEGNNKYDNLIIFKGSESEAEPLPKKIASGVKAVTPSAESTALKSHTVDGADVNGKSVTSFFRLEFNTPNLKEWAISFMQTNWQKQNSGQLTTEERECLQLAIACHWAMNNGIYSDFNNGYRAVESSWMTAKASGETSICNWAKQWKTKQLVRS